MSEGKPTIEPRCVATSGTLYRCSVSETQKREASELGDDRWSSGSSPNEDSNIFKDAQWSPDGTCVLTSSEDNRVRTFVMPTDLLENREPHDLIPFSITSKAEPVYCSAIYPGFVLQDPSTTCFLTSTRDHPIHLQDALTPRIRGSYPLISPTTEKYIAPHSILWSSSGTKFICGSDTLISVFDISRVGASPVERLPTIPSKRKKIVGGGVGMKGIVSALGLSDQTGSGILAAGTFTRMVGLYGSEGSGDCIAVFSIAQMDEGGFKNRAGAGITALEWSPCGRYLYVAERMSTEILVYDIRVASRQLGSLTGRTALSNQRLGIHVVPVDGGHEVWAGCDDGTVQTWRHTGEDPETPRQPDWAWKAHDGPIATTIVHPSGTIVGTCSGQRHVPLDADEESEGSSDCADISPASPPSHPAERIFDNSLKIWKI
ncbi:MAG: hypothetical protein M1813_006648 [Trichoglossum hirsutum]|nr:MAG: hypothetical protein M1813_006648 [Trichoglossum hirsutum]